MPQLENHPLRNQAMKQFLETMAIDTRPITIQNNNHFYIFTDANETLSGKLEEVLFSEITPKPGIKQLNLKEIIQSEVQNASCEDEIDRESCKGVLATLISKQDIQVNVEENCILIPLRPGYMELLKLLNYSHISFETNYLKLNMQPYLAEISNPLVQLNLQPQAKPIVYLKAEALKSKILYQSKTLEDGKIAMTPFFIVPRSKSLPIYRCVLDTSQSMREKDRLANLKKACLALVDQIYAFEPEATIRIDTFSNNFSSLGDFKKEDIECLQSKINALKAESTTVLYQTVYKLMYETFEENSAQRILLFTDGVDNGSTVEESDITYLINQIEKEDPKKFIRNKFYIFSYKTEQPEIIHKVAETYASEVINSQHIDFLNNLNDPQKMKAWAASRDLFRFQLIIESEKSGANHPYVYTESLDQSEQLFPLKPILCAPGESFKLKIFNGNDEIILESHKEIPPALAAPCSANSFAAKAMGQFGLHGSNSKSESSSHLLPTEEENVIATIQNT